MRYRIKRINIVLFDEESEEQREFDEAFSELVRDAFFDIVVPEGFADRFNRTLEQIAGNNSTNNSGNGYPNYTDAAP